MSLNRKKKIRFPSRGERKAKLPVASARRRTDESDEAMVAGLGGREDHSDDGAAPGSEEEQVRDAVERQMIADVGLFRAPAATPSAQVEQLLQLRRGGKPARPAVDARLFSGVAGHALQRSQSSDSASRRRGSGSGRGGSVKKGSALKNRGEESLLATMSRRLADVERMCRVQSGVIAERDEALRLANMKIASLTQQLESQAGDDDGDESRTGMERAEDMYQLKLEHERLRKQVYEMEVFLSDYGLVWVGYRASDDVERLAPKDAERPAAPDPDDIFFDMNRMLTALDDLNSVAGEGSMRIVHSDSGGAAKFEPPEQLKIAFFRDGMFLKNGPLRKYSLPEARAFVADVLDGYFPYELKDRYPDGVVFRVTDYSHLRFAEFEEASRSDSEFRAFQGKGHLLSRVPENVTSGGKVIAVRAGLAEFLSPRDKTSASERASQGMILVPTPVLDQMHDATDEPQTPRDVATLRVKLDDPPPTATLMIKLRFLDTVGQLYEYVAQYRQAQGDFELRTSFPRRAHTDHSQSLSEAGLTPNAALFVRSLEES